MYIHSSIFIRTSGSVIITYYIKRVIANFLFSLVALVVPKYWAAVVNLIVLG